MPSAQSVVSSQRQTWTTRDDGYGDTYEYFADQQLYRYRYSVWRPDLNFWNPPGWTDTFNYDQVGNRTSLDENGTVTSYTANALNQYTAVTGTFTSYDGRGNLVDHNGWVYAYNAENQLIKATKIGTIIQFYYDPEGRLTRVNRSGTDEYRYYDWGQCFFRSRADGTWIDFMVWGPTPDELISRWDAAHGGWSFFHRTPVNSPDLATDINANVVERYLYDPFGAPDIRDPSWGGRSASVIYNPWLFTGQEWMSDTGLSNYKARFYSPKLGRFLQNDPVRFDAGDVNLYRYCLNEPINRSDPNGLTWKATEEFKFQIQNDSSKDTTTATGSASVTLEKTVGNLTVKGTTSLSESTTNGSTTSSTKSASVTAAAAGSDSKRVEVKAAASTTETAKGKSNNDSISITVSNKDSSVTVSIGQKNGNNTISASAGTKAGSATINVEVTKEGKNIGGSVSVKVEQKG